MIKKYVIVLKQMEDNKFSISFPDFPDLTTMAEDDSSIEERALTALKLKLGNMQKNGLEVPEPKKYSEISPTLTEGQFLSSVKIDVMENSPTITTTNTNEINKNNSSILSQGNNTDQNEIVNSNEHNNNKNISKLNSPAKSSTATGKNALDDFINKNIRAYIPLGQENILAVIAGAIGILDALFISFAVSKGPYGGINMGIGFFSSQILGMTGGFWVPKEVFIGISAILFVGLLFITMSATIIYAGLKKNKSLIKYSMIGFIVYLILYYILFYMGLSESGYEAYVGASYVKIFLNILTVCLTYLSYKLIANNETEVKE